jgi:hypothetical protein
MICQMEWERNNGMMAQNMMVILQMGPKMGEGL